MVAVKIITVSTASSAIVYFKSKFDISFRKMEPSKDSDSDTIKEVILLHFLKQNLMNLP